MTRYLQAFGKPTFLLGVNYWSRRGGPRMWEADRFDADFVRNEVAEMRAMGMNACRSFLFAPTFLREPPRVDADALGRFRKLVSIAEEAGLALLPSLLVGHMSGENFDIPGQLGRSPYDTIEVVGWERALARAACGAAGASRAISAWVLSNEMPLWGGPAPVPTIAAWTKALGDEVRGSAAPGTPIGTGDGVMNLKGGQNGFDPEALAHFVDYLAPHVYPADSDPLRQALYSEYAIRSLQHLGKPVLLEEFGCSSGQAGETEQALYWRETIAAAMGVGAAGTLGWCWSDFALGDEVPYTHHAFELGFGVVRADGTEKPVCAELRQASRHVASIDWAEHEVPAPRAAIVRPSYFDTTYPFSWEDRSRMTRTLVQSYALARKAGLEVAIVPETHALADFDLLLVPSTQKLLAPTWERLAARVREGAILYWSYFGGDYDFHQGMWCHLFEPLFGCRHRLRYGVPDLPADPTRITAAGFTLESRTGFGSPFAQAFLPLQPLAAQVLARDEAGRPALVRHAVGDGLAYLCAYPWEHYLASQPDINARDRSQALYAHLADTAGIERDPVSPDGSVQTHRARGPSGQLLWAINRSWERVEARIGAPGGEGTYAPKEVRLLRLA